ncbi:hypothetical protein P154DRAFT_607443 [Amniculicola lignicola CBS 123094]|uniref:Uncharacterized protein n=1 Tax=Amniculicola lignicola CBS 123094 TaxID=1392246 RepID=A0A6A5W7H6_9PLEO|nr:hypothetical protein P154DRAFT_607443 [Amniculicola lignicola CBS 123094]
MSDGKAATTHTRPKTYLTILNHIFINHFYIYLLASSPPRLLTPSLLISSPTHPFTIALYSFAGIELTLGTTLRLLYPLNFLTPLRTLVYMAIIFELGLEFINYADDKDLGKTEEEQKRRGGLRRNVMLWVILVLCSAECMLAVVDMARVGEKVRVERERVRREVDGSGLA